MKEIEVPAIYIVEDRIPKGKAEDRRDRLLTKIKSSTIEVIKGCDLEDLIESMGWYKKATTGSHRKGNPSIILSGFDWDDTLNNPAQIKDPTAFIPGRFRFADYRDNKQLLDENNVACNSGAEIHTAFGCFHACDYCHVGNAFAIMLDLEEFAVKVDKLREHIPWQKLYKFDNQTDNLLLEPEYESSKLLVDHFAQTDAYLMLYSKSDNVDHLLELDHKRHTIVCLTLSPDFCAEKYEHGTPSLAKRIEAAKKCQDASYPIRFRFSPIIPVEDWRGKNREMIKAALSDIRPDYISIEMLCHMDQLTLENSMDTTHFDQRFLKRWTTEEYQLFPHELRREVYSFFVSEIRKYDQNVRIALCLETPQMWRDVKNDGLSGNAKDFGCCCGAKCVSTEKYA